MTPKKIWSNLAVSDLARTTRFYTALGFKPTGSNNELTGFQFGESGFVINFLLKEVLEKNTKSQIADANTANEVIFSLSAQSTAEADQWAKEIETAGGKLVSQPREFGKGYYGFDFADPDGHRFNVFFMEGM